MYWGGAAAGGRGRGGGAAAVGPDRNAQQGLHRRMRGREPKQVGMLRHVIDPHGLALAPEVPQQRVPLRRRFQFTQRLLVQPAGDESLHAVLIIGDAQGRVAGMRQGAGDVRDLLKLIGRSRGLGLKDERCECFERTVLAVLGERLVRWLNGGGRFCCAHG